jgi:N-succinyldiaminopimelate aminotransferase
VNPDLSLLQPYPFERLRSLFTRELPAVAPARPTREIKLSIGEPQHATPTIISESLAANLAGLASYPTTQGIDALRETLSAWIARRYTVPAPNPGTQILPVNGSREALFSFTQAIIARQAGAKVVCPNPFYQIYEGAALLAGAQPLFLNTLPENDFTMDWSRVDASTWREVQLVFVCSPGNPTGKVMSLDEWRVLFDLADRHDFVIASDECYSEIYFSEGQPPLGALSAARQLGRDDYRRLMVFSSLSKRSNVPGLRSGFVAGDAALIKAFLLYRTYHGSAMGPHVQLASIAAWNDEAHVIENRRLYAQKFSEVTPIISAHLPCAQPDAGFYLWANTRATGLSDAEFVLGLHRQQNVLVLPGSYLARDADGCNPGDNFVRIALVATPEECLDAARRIESFCLSL